MRMTNTIRQLLLLTLVATLASCGGGEESTPEPPRLDPAVAERLAAASDAVADALEAGDGCRASGQIDDLSLMLHRERLPAAIRRRAELGLTRAAADVVCVPNQPPPAVTETDEEDDEHKGKKKDKKHGHDDEEDDD